MIKKGNYMQINKLQERVLSISYKFGLSHLGSVLTALPLIESIYDVKGDNEPFILSNGHAGLALYVVLEKRYGFNAEELFEKHGVHPNRDIEHQIWASTGSLGHGIGIAVGMALADRTKNCYCMVSDGECSEGSFWEALRIAAEQELTNLIILINANGWGAYKSIELDRLEWMISAFVKNKTPRVSFNKTNLEEWPAWIQGQNGHYVILDDVKYKELIT